MIRRGVLTSVAVLAFMLSAPNLAEAQSIFFGGGVTFPVGFYGNANEVGAKTGWMVAGGLSWDLGSSGSWIYGEGFYGENKHQNSTIKTNPYGGMLGFGYSLGAPGQIGGYFFAGGGLMVHKFSSEDAPAFNDSESKFGYELGAGGDFPLGSRVSLWVEGRYMGATDTNFFGLLAGFTIRLGSTN